MFDLSCVSTLGEVLHATYFYLYCRTSPGMKSHYDEVSKQYEQDRRTVILPLGNV